MKTEFLLVGQGLCGTWLSYFLEQEKRDFIVLDPGHLPNASLMAGGLINPVTGRRLVTTWLIDELMPFAQLHYTELGQQLYSEQYSHSPQLIEERSILQFFSHPDSANIFTVRATEQQDYLHRPTTAPDSARFFDPLLGLGLIKKSYQIALDVLLPAYKDKLRKEGRLLEKKFNYQALKKSSNGFRFEDIEFDQLIFCDGIGLHDNPLFDHLPVAPVKGEALIVQAPGLPATHIFKGPLTMTPLKRTDHWWVGSSYEWDFTDAQPSEQFRTSTEHSLRQWLKVPFTVADHWAAIRPGSKERRPFVGKHPQEPRIGLLGGMGTKGCSLAPYFARQLVQHLLYDAPLHPEADLGRFNIN
ncbi:MAG: FAD-dependent oxidoreductase [Sphingomonadales bacterium]|nr:FAD-dependent oxidoreductase [Sphingomonadales bacterium]